MEERRVYELDLHAKSLKMLPADLKKLKSLRLLDASCNEITKLKGLSENKELRELKLYGNSIDPLDGLEKLTELNTLLLHYNKISSIGKGLKQCCKLRVLRLDHNLLGSIHVGELASCSGTLTYLDLSHNQLASVERLEALGNLVELNLENNRLKEVPNLSHCRKLNELNLSGNPLPTHQLSHLKALQLKTLKLGSISLSSISPLPKLPQLQDLHLPQNLLSCVDTCSSLFPSLELLNLQGNQLETIQTLTSLAPLRELTELQVEENPLCSSVENYRADVTKVLPTLELLDGVSLLTGVASVESSKVPLMRPLTPSTVGPSLRQVERQLVEAEIQLRNSGSEIASKFKRLQSQGDEKDGTIRDTGSVQRTCDRDFSGTETHTNKPEGEASRTEGLSSPDGEKSPNRPSTQSRSRARLQEALTYANR